MRPRLRAVAPALLALAPAARAGAQSASPPPLGPGRVAAQVATGILGTPIGFLAAGVPTDRIFERVDRDTPEASRLSLAAAWTGATLVTAAGPALIGARGPGSGRYAAAVGGAAAGLLASWAVERLVDRDGRDSESPPRGGTLVGRIAAGVILALPGVGATLGYDASRRVRR